MSPSHPEAARERAYALHRAGRLADAEAAYRSLLAQDPTDGETAHRFAVLLGQTDRPADVIKFELAALRCGYRTAAVFANIASAHQALGDPFAAATAAGQALDISPEDRGLLDDIAPLLRAGGQEPRLLRALQLQAPARANNLEELLEFGALAAGLGHHDLALPALSRATELASEAAEPWLNLATLHVTAGDRDAAEAAAWHAVACGQRTVAALFLLAHLGPGIGQRARLKSRITSNLATTEGQKSAQLHFADARLREDDEDFAGATQSYRTGNRLVRSTLSYDRAATTAASGQLAAMIRDVDLTLLQAGPDDAGPVPIFIVGAPRAGSTLVEQLLVRQAGVATVGELVWFQRIVTHVLAAERKPFPKGLAQVSLEGLAKIRRTYRSILADRAEGAAFVVDKLPANILYAPLALALFPNARVLVVERSAADTCLSIYRHLFTGHQSFAYDLFEIAEHVAACRRIAAALCERHADRASIVHLEELIADPSQATSAVLAFCGVTDRLAPGHRKTLVQTASALQVRQPVSWAATVPCARFRPHLPELQFALDAAKLAP